MSNFGCWHGSSSLENVYLKVIEFAHGFVVLQFLVPFQKNSLFSLTANTFIPQTEIKTICQLRTTLFSQASVTNSSDLSVWDASKDWFCGNLCLVDRLKWERGAPHLKLRNDWELHLLQQGNPRLLARTASLATLSIFWWTRKWWSNCLRGSMNHKWLEITDSWRQQSFPQAS